MQHGAGVADGPDIVAAGPDRVPVAARRRLDARPRARPSLQQDSAAAGDPDAVARAPDTAQRAIPGDASHRLRRPGAVAVMDDGAVITHRPDLARARPHGAQDLTRRGPRGRPALAVEAQHRTQLTHRPHLVRSVRDGVQSVVLDAEAVPAPAIAAACARRRRSLPRVARGRARVGVPDGGQLAPHPAALLAAREQQHLDELRCGPLFRQLLP